MNLQTKVAVKPAEIERSALCLTVIHLAIITVAAKLLTNRKFPAAANGPNVTSIRSSLW